MNEPADAAEDPANSSLANAATGRPARSFAHWLSSFLACNPFYISSAALLLYGFYRVSIDPHFLPRETAQLIFNFSALQSYEILIVLTALFLAARQVWYDSVLLVTLENLLVLVPFILISEAALIDRRLVAGMCLAAGCLALGRAGCLKRWIGELNFPPRLRRIGLVVLALNVSLPIIYRILHEYKFGTKPDWGAAYYTNQCLWLFALPGLCALWNFVPFTRTAGGPLPARGWLPLAWFSLWLAATGVHLYCLGYVYDFDLRRELVTPGIWLLTWMAYRRALIIIPRLSSFEQGLLLALPAVATLLAVGGSDPRIFLALTLLDATIYARMYGREPRRRLALHLLLLSVAGLLAGLPKHWGPTLVTNLSQAELIVGSGVGYLLFCVSLSRDPRNGMGGALVAFATTWGLLGDQANALHWAVQAGLAFLLIHSLRWRDAHHAGASTLRAVVSLVWVGHGVLWMHTTGSDWMVCAVAVLVLGGCLAQRLLAARWGTRLVPWAAVLAALSGPGQATAMTLHSAPIGLLAVLGSFLLFAFGTLTAVTRRQRRDAKRREDSALRVTLPTDGLLAAVNSGSIGKCETRSLWRWMCPRPKRR